MKNPNVIVCSDYGSIIVNANDSGVGRTIIESGYYATIDIELIKQLLNFLYLRKDKLVLYDVGANIGTHVLALAKTYGEKLSIRAFEAQRFIFYMTCGTVAINGLQNVHCYNLAVSNENGKYIDLMLPDYSKENNFGSFELVPPIKSDNQNMVKNSNETIGTVTLDSFNESVDFIKMDVEGMEDKALEGAERVIRNSRPICFIETLKSDFGFLVNYFHSKNYCGFQKGDDLIAIPLEFAIQIEGLARTF